MFRLVQLMEKIKECPLGNRNRKKHNENIKKTRYVVNSIRSNISQRKGIKKIFFMALHPVYFRRIWNGSELY